MREFIADFDAALPDSGTAEEYARLHAELARAGTPIPSNDLWIAALAVERGMTVVTSDDHFRRIPSLVLENWLD